MSLNELWKIKWIFLENYSRFSTYFLSIFIRYRLFSWKMGVLMPTFTNILLLVFQTILVYLWES